MRRPRRRGYCGYLVGGGYYDNLSFGFGCNNGWVDLGFGNRCMDDTITMVRVDSINDNCQSPGTGQASIFEDPDQNAGNPSRDCVVLRPGTYSNPFANPTSGYLGGGFGLNNDVITSVNVGSGAVLRLYPDPNSAGTWIDIPPGVFNLYALSPNLNDRTSSILLH